MSELRDDPDLMLEVLAKLVHRLGGYVKVMSEDSPSGEFDLQSRLNREDGCIELKLDVRAGTA